MKMSKAMPWWGWLAWILAVTVGVIAYFHLPAHIVGNGHRMNSRILVVAYEPAVMLVIILLWHVFWKIDPRKRNYESFWPTYQYIGGVIIVCMALVYLTILGHVLNIASMRLIPTVVGIMFMLIANVLPRLQPNWWIGFRTPWTLSNTESWNRTHRLGGQLGIPTGILIIILVWVLPTTSGMIVAVIAPILLWLLIGVIASYFYAKKG